MKIKKLLVFITLIFSCHTIFAQIDTEVSQLINDSMEVDSVRRYYSYYVPNGIGENPHLMFALHGAGSSGSQLMQRTGYVFNAMASHSKNLIVVYPDGFGQHWNDCRKASPRETKQLNIDEAAFFEGMIRKFQTDYNIVPSKVFIAGFSNGAHMTYKLAMQEPQMFAGYAAICGNLPEPDNSDCEAAQNNAVSMLIANGTSDPIIPYAGGFVYGTQEGEMLSTNETVAYWAGLLRCDDVVPSQTMFADLNETDDSTAKVFEYQCKGGAKKVMYIEIENGGHTIPNPDFDDWEPIMGNVNKDINLPYLIIEFFNSLR